MASTTVIHIHCVSARLWLTTYRQVLVRDEPPIPSHEASSPGIRSCQPSNPEPVIMHHVAVNNINYKLIREADLRRDSI